jgi:hypothetical protein
MVGPGGVVPACFFEQKIISVFRDTTKLGLRKEQSFSKVVISYAFSENIDRLWQKEGCRNGDEKQHARLAALRFFSLHVKMPRIA